MHRCRPHTGDAWCAGGERDTRSTTSATAAVVLPCTSLPRYRPTDQVTVRRAAPVTEADGRDERDREMGDGTSDVSVDRSDVSAAESGSFPVDTTELLFRRRIIIPCLAVGTTRR